MHLDMATEAPSSSSGFRVQEAFRFRVQGLGFRVQGSGFRVQGSGFRVWGANLKMATEAPSSSSSAGPPPQMTSTEDNFHGPDDTCRGSGFRVERESVIY